MRKFCLMICAILAVTASAQSKRPFAPEDYHSLLTVADPQISPDGRSVAYVLVSVNEKEDRYDTNVWVVPAAAGSEPRRLTEGPRDFAPRWSPDGRTLAFLRSGRAVALEVSPRWAPFVRTAALSLAAVNWAYLIVAGR